MDMTKKLEDTYMPDKEGRKSKVLVALSGGIHSFVAAYLLKIQKYELVGVTVVLGDGEPGKNTFSCKLNASELEGIKAFCKSLGISHIVVSAEDQFEEVVINPWLAKKISGKAATPCWNCHTLRMSLLFSKASELGISQVATGHFAKVFKNEGQKSVYVHTGNEEESDHSVLLSRLNHEWLEKLMLPLSDLQEKEVVKLAENFGVMPNVEKLHNSDCLGKGDRMIQFIESRVPVRFLKGGEVFDSENDKLGNHVGIYRSSPGQEIVYKDSDPGDELVFGKCILKENKVIAVSSDYFIVQRFILTSCKVSEETPWSGPFKAIVRTLNQEYCECWVYPKNSLTAFIVLDDAVKLFEGEIVSIQKKKGKNAKVFLSGEVKYISEERKEEGQNNATIPFNPITDF